jgi:hypothetical protein
MEEPSRIKFTTPSLGAHPLCVVGTVIASHYDYLVDAGRGIRMLAGQPLRQYVYSSPWAFAKRAQTDCGSRIFAPNVAELDLMG